MAGIRSKLKSVIKKTSTKMPSPIGTGLAIGGLAALGHRIATQTGGSLGIPASYQSDIEDKLRQAEAQAKSEKIGKLMEQARVEEAIRQNQARLAQVAPDVYTSVMAGRRVPKGSVVLGGRPRQDLMRELAASMGSGRFEKKDPLSELLG